MRSSPDNDAVQNTILDQGVTWPWMTNEKQIADLGVIGDAQAASAEFGLYLLKQIEDMAGPDIQAALGQAAPCARPEQIVAPILAYSTVPHRYFADIW